MGRTLPTHSSTSQWLRSISDQLTERSRAARKEQSPSEAAPLTESHPLLSARKIPELEGVKIPDGSERVMIEGTEAEIPRQRDAGEAWKETNNRKSLFQAFIDCMAAA